MGKLGELELNAIRNKVRGSTACSISNAAIDIVIYEYEKSLAEQEDAQEPVAWVTEEGLDNIRGRGQGYIVGTNNPHPRYEMIPLYTKPQPLKRLGDDELLDITHDRCFWLRSRLQDDTRLLDVYHAIQDAIQEKNR